MRRLAAARPASRAAFAASLAALLAAAGPAHAACEETARISQPDSFAPLAIGDSVMVAAGDHLGRRGFAVDAKSCRRFDQGLAVMAARRLPDVVVVALGSNASVSAAQIERALDLVGPFGRLVLVKPRGLGGGSDADGRVMEAAASAYPDQIAVLDWPAHSAGQSGWFAPDGLHLTGAGARAFADFIAQADPGRGGGTMPPADELGPPPEAQPLPGARREPAGPRRSRLVAGLLAAAAGALADLLRPGLNVLEGLFDEPGDLGQQDL